MVGYDDFRNGTHAYGIATYHAVHLILGRCLEGWSLYTDIDTIGDADLLLAGNGRSLLDEFHVVGLVHVREAGTRREVLSTQRVFREHVDMVGDDHQVANLEGGVHATSGIGHEERLDAQFVHHTDGECHLLHGVALVEVETTLHGEDVNATQFSEDELARMTFYGRYGKVGDVRIGKLPLVSYF